MLLHEDDMTAPSTLTPARKRAPKPKRPPHLAHGRWLGDLEDEAPLSDAEWALVAACARGEVWEPEGWDGEVPTAATSANTIRASLIRFLLLGGDAEHPVHEEGVTASGAWISGALDIYQARCPVRLALQCCHLAETPNLRAATLPELGLGGSVLPGLHADRLVVTGGCFLCEGFTASGEVRLLGAEIGGDLDCVGATFANADGKAFNAQSLMVKGGLLLRGAKVEGAISLATAHIGTLVDDGHCWQAGGHFLDGLHYDRIIGPTDAASRIAWLKQQYPDHLMSEFKPQPWEQLIKTLREMGHPYDASEVAIAKQDQMRKAGVIRGGVRSVMHWLYGKIAGYGYRPIWTVYWMIGLWLFCGACFEVGREWGFFGPTNPLIHASAALEMCGGAGEGKPYWTSAACPVPPEYTTMWPWVYSLDLLLPLVNLQQDVDWAPIVINGNGDQLVWGYLLRALLWFEILFGWAASLILVAVLGRLVEKD
jgi:hypothetical protein